MSISRRDFLKLAAAGALGAWLNSLGVDAARAAQPAAQGRVAYPKLTLYDRPGVGGIPLGELRRDALIPLTEKVLGDDPDTHNPYWYRVGADGYVQAGGVQPVEDLPNEAVDDIPVRGAVAEVTVPFVDAHYGAGPGYKRGYRLYYQTTHWVIGAREGDDRQPWYYIYDDRFRIYYWAPAYALRFVPPHEMSPLSPEVPEDEKLIVVGLKQQRLLAFEGERLALLARVSTGRRYTPTPLGSFKTFHKRSTRHMAMSNYDLPGVPWCTFITENGVAFHGTYWHDDYGMPHSHGCINMPSKQAQWLFRWTTPVVPTERRFLFKPGMGTPVQVIKDLSDFKRSKIS